MDDHRHPGAPELGAGVGVRHLARELLGELAVDDRDMYAGFLEHSAVQEPDLAAAAIRPGPRLDVEPAGRALPMRAALVLDRLEAGTEVVADLAEPGGGGGLLGVDVGGEGHFRLAKALVCRMASPIREPPPPRH